MVNLSSSPGRSGKAPYPAGLSGSPWSGYTLEVCVGLVRVAAEWSSARMFHSPHETATGWRRRRQNVSENSVCASSSSWSLVLVLVLEIPRKIEDEGRRARTSTRHPHIFQTRSQEAKLGIPWPATPPDVGPSDGYEASGLACATAHARGKSPASSVEPGMGGATGLQGPTPFQPNRVTSAPRAFP
jgi:hypothetical protein